MAYKQPTKNSPAQIHSSNSMAITSCDRKTTTTTAAPPSNDEALKIAIAISLLRSKLFNHHHLPSSDALRWKQKAKERKQEILRLRDELRETEDRDLFPQTATCKCYFFDNLGKKQVGDVSDRTFNDVIRRRFLKQVRLSERRRRRIDGSDQRRRLDTSSEDDAEQLRASVDFLMELCETASPAAEGSFANWSHQAVDFILASLRNLLSNGKNMELIEGIVTSLVMCLVRRMCSPSHGDESNNTDADAQFYIQHLIRKLGSESYVGQRAILSISQRIAVVAENLLFLDPFDDSFPNMHRSLFIMIQLIEFLISDYLLTWSGIEGFDIVLFEAWVVSVLHARRALELLENRNGLYALYMDRVMGQLAKIVSQVPLLQKLNQEVLDNLFR